MNKKPTPKSNNKGFTLIEVLVAMSILAIIVAPLLSSFVVAARANATARRIMQATTVAQNTMEGFKAYSLEDVCRAMNGYTVDENNEGFTCSITSLGTNAFEAWQDYSDVNSHAQVDANQIVDGALTKGASPSSVAPMYVTNADSTRTLMGVKFLGQISAVGSSHKSSYQFVIEGASVGGSATKYDEVITVEADDTTAIANISSMNREDCAYYVESNQEAPNMAAEFQQRYLTHLGITQAEVVTDPDFLNRMTRTMVITIDGGITTVDYTYNCGAGYTSLADQTISDSRIVYNELVSNTNMSSVYVYYYPLYGTGVRDTFRVINKSGREVTVYLIKMVGSGYNTFNENSYRTDLYIQDMNGTNAAAATLTKICSNMKTAQFSSVDFNTVSGTDEKALINDLGNSSEEYVKYSVTIDVYIHDDSNFSTAGGKRTFNSTSAKKMTTFTGSFTDDSKLDN